jgi:alpha-ketoglutarate-dependent taurine dioxygenase
VQATSDPPPARRVLARPAAPWRGSELSATAYTFTAGEPQLADRAVEALAACTDTPAAVRTTLPAIDRVSALLVERAPVIAGLARQVRERLERRPRFVILRGLGFPGLPDALRDALVLGFSNLVGVPTPADSDPRLVRELRGSDDGAPAGQAGRRRDVELRTDASHTQRPERYVSLWCVRAGDDAGPIRLVDGRAAVDVLGGSVDGRELLATLRDVPLSFGRANAVRASVVSDRPFVRFARRAIDDGARQAGESLTPFVRASLDAFERACRTPGLPLALSLRAGDALFLNNHEALHGLGDAADGRRQLLRVGLHPRE